MYFKRILVVDDEESIRSLLKTGLSELGYVVSLAENGEEALHLLEKGSFDILIIDLVMPGMNGLDLIKKIRERGSNVVVFVITGYPTIENASESLTQGAYDYFVKPFNLGEMQVKIYRALEKKKLEKRIKTMERLLLGLCASMLSWFALTILVAK
jgi:DNA-binding NtrC family response regulator